MSKKKPIKKVQPKKIAKKKGQVKKTEKTKHKRAQKSLKKASSAWYKDTRTLALLAAILVITFICFTPSLHENFTNWDDQDYVTENPYVVNIDARSVNAMFTQSIASNYHPLTILSLAINYQMTGLNASSYHWTNLILHLINTFLVFYFAFLLFERKTAGALLVAFLFAIHPMHVESVAWVAERKDVLYTLFFVGALITYLKYLSNKSMSMYIATLVLFVLSCLSKPTAVMLPVVLLLVDFLKHRDWKMNVLLEKAPFFIGAIVFGIITIRIQSSSAIGDFEVHSIGEKFLFAAYGTFMYIAQMFAPFKLSALHPYPPVGTASSQPVFYVALLVVLALGGLMFWSLRKTRMITFGLLFYGAMIALTLQFVQVGSALISDRYTYVSYIGLFVIFGWLLNEFLAKNASNTSRQYGVLGLIGLVGALLCFLTFNRCKVWQDSGKLFSDVLKSYPDSKIAHNNLGNYYVDEAKQMDQGLVHLNRAVELDPNYYKARVARGKVFRLTRKYNEALADYNKAISLKPNDDEAYNNRGNVYFNLQQYDKALADYQKVMELNPGEPKAYGNSGAIYLQKGNFSKAFELLDKALKIYPGYQDALMNQGTAYALNNRPNEAIQSFTKYLSLRKDNPAIYHRRGAAYAKLNQHQQALNDFNNAIQLNPNRAEFYAGRAATHQQLGNVAQAQADRQKAQQLGGGQ